MCGIVGYIGKRDATPVLVEGLHRLEYRGYDSAGLAVVHRGRLQITKTAGRVQDLRDKLDAKQAKATIGIGHTRWATHGEPNERQRPPAHRHRSTASRVVHNGIIENAEQLRDQLTADGVQLVTDTDTEALAHMIAAELAANDDDVDASKRRSSARCAASRAPTASSSSTRRTPTSWSSPATAARSCSASARARCSSPPTSPRSSATPARSSTWRTARSRRSRRPTTAPRR